jgi:hypothetical protein
MRRRTKQPRLEYFLTMNKGVHDRYKQTEPNSNFFPYTTLDEQAITFRPASTNRSKPLRLLMLRHGRKNVVGETSTFPEMSDT